MITEQLTIGPTLRLYQWPQWHDIAMILWPHHIYRVLPKKILHKV